MTQHRILIADDDPHIARLVKSYLEQAGFVVLTANDGEQALHLLRSERPDMAVLDVMMPKRDGFALAQLIRGDKQLAALPILMLTARVEDADRLKGLDIGADDYLTKPFNPLEVVARVKAILRRANGGIQLSPVLQHKDLQMNVEQRSVLLKGEVMELTPTEYELLRALMQNLNHAFTRGELIEKALGFGYEGFDRTIDSHIRNLRRKIEPDPANPIYIETVFGVGYRMSNQ
jgi:two-component system, OmpR family, alkaline phosphatase synthesis response regulator PhoP